MGGGLGAGGSPGMGSECRVWGFLLFFAIFCYFLGSVLSRALGSASPPGVPQLGLFHGNKFRIISVFSTRFNGLNRDLMLRMDPAEAEQLPLAPHPPLSISLCPNSAQCGGLGASPH